MSARAKLAKTKSPKLVDLDYDFAGMKRGTRMFVATPQIVDAYIRRIPYGKTRTITAMRREMARQRGADNTCPVSLSIFIRIVAEAALEDMADGTSSEEIAPFWRLITSQDKVASKLDLPEGWLEDQRALEQQLGD